MLTVYRILVALIILLIFMILGGTLYVIFSRSGPAEQTPVFSVETSAEVQTFTGIGRLRIPMADPEPGVVILAVSFPYLPEDRAFSEELAFRIRDFREIIMDYMGSFSGEELQKKDEELIKADLLQRFNRVLRLGQIERLFFTDFMILR